MSQEPNETQSLEKKCNLLLNEPAVRFVGFINNMGRQIAGGYKPGITPLVDEEEHKISLEHALEVLLTKDLDESLGSIDSIVTRRKKVTMITHLELIPKMLAMPGFSATARIPRPILVFWINRSRETMRVKATTKMTIWAGETARGPKFIT